MSKSVNWWTRKVHRWLAVLAAIPLGVVIVSGLLLQVKKQVAWVQPSTAKGHTQALTVSWEAILAASQAVPAAQVADWEDIIRMDVQPSRGLIKVLCKNGWELQLDTHNGQILSSAYRRSDLIESIHDGSYFSQPAKLWLFLPNGIALLVLWFTGLYLWYLPWKTRRARRARRRKLTA